MADLNAKLPMVPPPSQKLCASDALAMLRAASEAVSQQHPPRALKPLKPAIAAAPVLPPLRVPTPLRTSQPSKSSHDLSALLNPMSPSEQMVPPAGFVVGKDGKLRKKRGRKPTPGLSEEQRRQARLLKNRRTAETSRRRKIALMKRLTVERDDAHQAALKMCTLINLLHERLAAEMNISVHKLLETEPRFRAPQWPKQTAAHCESAQCSTAGAQRCVTPEQSDVSRAPSVAESEEESSACNGANANAA